MDKALVFGAAFKGLLVDGLEDRSTAELRAAVLEVGVDLDRPLPAYPLEVWVRALAVAVRAFPELSTEAAQTQLGVSTVQGMRKSDLGKARAERNLLLGPKRALEQFTRTFRISNNYLEAELSPRGSAHLLLLRVVEDLRAEVESSGLPPVGYYRGVFLEMLRVWGAEGGRVEPLPELSSPSTLAFEVSFREAAAR